MSNKEELLKKQEELSKSLNDTQKELSDVLRQIRVIEDEERAEALKKLKVEDGAYFVGFSDGYYGYHYTLICGFHVLCTSKSKRTTNTAFFKYRCDDDCYTLRVEFEQLSLNELSGLMDSFKFYSVTEEEYSKLLVELSSLSVTSQKANEIERAYKDKLES